MIDIDELISDLRYVAELPSTDGIDAELLTKAADQLASAKKQVASDQQIIEAQARNINALYKRVKELEHEKLAAVLRTEAE